MLLLSRAKATGKTTILFYQPLFTAVHYRLSRTFFLPLAHRMWHMLATVTLIASLVLLTLAVLPLPASAWNSPAHMLSAIIAYKVLHQEKPQIIEKVKAVLEKHPWYANHWQARLQDVPVADHGLVLFMQAPDSS